MSRAHARPRKTPTNLSIRSDLVDRAKTLRINLSQLLEDALEDALRERESADWLEENARAIDAYNAKVQDRGTFSDAWRRFCCRSSTCTRTLGAATTRCS